MATGLRERKKQRTRAAIAEAALELFASQGFSETRVDQIAAAADVSPRTFFSYFPTKEEAVFSELDTQFEGMRAKLSQRPTGVSTVEALREWIIERMSAPDFSDAEEVTRRTLIRATPELRAYEVAHVDSRFRAILAATVAEDLGQATEDLAPQMVAAAASAALRAMVDYYAEAGGDDDPEQLLDQAIGFLDAGLARLAQTGSEGAGT